MVLPRAWYIAYACAHWSDAVVATNSPRGMQKQLPSEHGADGGMGGEGGGGAGGDGALTCCSQWHCCTDAWPFWLLALCPVLRLAPAVV